MEQDHLKLETLRRYRETTSDLMGRAGDVHRLVRERIAALDEAFGEFNHPTETRAEHAERVLAKGQHPFPLGQCIYDELNNNTGYEHVEVGYGLAEDGEFRLTYSGWYPHWAPDGESYERRVASIHCPSWVITESDGEQRFRQQTSDMVAAVRAERERESALIDRLIQDAIRDREGRHE